MEGNWPGNWSAEHDRGVRDQQHSPNYSFVLLLSNVTGHLTVNLASAECHSQSLSHVLLDRGWDVRVSVGRSYPHLGRPLVLEFAPPELGEVGAANERQDHISREAFLNCRLETQRMCGVEKNAGVLRSNDGIDHRSQVVDVGKRFYTEDDVVKCAVFALLGRRFLWCSDNCDMTLFSIRSAGQSGGDMVREARECIPYRGLNRSLPKTGDLVQQISTAEAGSAEITYLNDIPYCDTCS